ncbi:MAG: hypothetical protein ACI4LO_01775 [Anaerovoracaceae bacterium]
MAEIVLSLVAISAVIASICFISVAIIRKFNRSLSPYRIFAIADIFVGICVAGYAVYDILTSVGWFAGLLGVLLLIFVMPIVAALLLADFLVWFLKNRKKNRL